MKKLIILLFLFIGCTHKEYPALDMCVPDNIEYRDTAREFTIKPES